MSKIFEASLNSDSGIPHDVLDAVFGVPSATDQPSPSPAVAVGDVPPVVTRALVPAPAVQATATAVTFQTNSDPLVNQSLPTGLVDIAVRAVTVRPPAAGPVLPFDDSHWFASEQYRTIRTRILHHPKRPRIVVVSSTGAADGKTVTSINIAAAMSLKTGTRVLLIDADLRKSSVCSTLGIERTVGLADVLGARVPLEDAIVRVEQFPNLYVLCAGDPRSNPAELFDSAAWNSVIAALRTQFGHIVIDSPPIAAVTDYDLLQGVSDGIVLVVRPDHTRRSRCLDALKTIAKDKLLGIVVNCSNNWFNRGGSPDAYSAYGYQGKTG